MAYSQSVEQWRPLVQKYFAPGDVDKALHVIKYESGGNPSAHNTNREDSVGLFQMNRQGGLGAGKPVSFWKNPENNIAHAARAVYGGSGWSPWGENSGGQWGSLGFHPYDGGGAGVSIVDGYYSRRAVEIQKQIDKIDEQIRIARQIPTPTQGTKNSQRAKIDSLETDKAILVGQLDEIIPAAKQEQIDGGGDDSWFDRESLAQGWEQIEQEWARIAQGDERIDQGWADLGISQIHADVAKGRLELDKAMAMIEERLAKQAEARQRATFIEDRLAEASRWAPQEPGKTDYSGTDVSAAHGQALAQRGFDPEATVAKYSGTRQVDPAATFAQQDQYMGVGQKGSAPGMGWQEGDAPGTGGSQIPGETEYSPGPTPPGGGGGGAPGAPGTGTGSYGSRETAGLPRNPAPPGPTYGSRETGGGTVAQRDPKFGSRETAGSPRSPIIKRPTFAGNAAPEGHPAGVSSGSSILRDNRTGNPLNPFPKVLDYGALWPW